MKPKLGQIQFYKQGREVMALPWAGNAPHGWGKISQQEWEPIAKQRYSGGKSVYEQMEKIGYLDSNFRDPSFAKYQPDAPTPSEQYYTEEHKANLAKETIGKVNIGTPDAPLWVPSGSPAQQLSQQPQQPQIPSTQIPQTQQNVASLVDSRVDNNGSRIKGIAEQVAGIRSRADEIQEEINKKKEAVVAKRNAEIETEGDIKVLTNQGQVGFDWQSEVENTTEAKNGANAVDKIKGDTLDLAVSKDIPYELQIPDYIKTGKAEAEETIQQMLSNLENSDFSREAKTREEFEAWGVEETFEQLKSIQGQAVSARKNLSLLEDEEREALDRIENRTGMSMSYLRGEQSRIANEYGKKKAKVSAELASFALESQMLQNNLSLATNYADRLVDAACWDYEQELNKWDTTLTFAYDMKESLTKAEFEIFEINYEQAEARYEEAKIERKQIVDWATDPKYAPAFYGVDLSDISVDKAVEKINTYLTNRAKLQKEDLLSPSECATLGVPYGTTEEDAQQMGITPERWKPTQAGAGGGEEWSKNQIGEYIRKGVEAGKGWAVLAGELSEQGCPTFTGSTADKLLNDYFGGGSGSGSGSGDLFNSL